MSRPAVPRRVQPGFTARGFRPIGTGPGALEHVELDLSHLEAIRLVDREGLYQEAAAERMGVSRPTFARILARARAAVAECLLENKALLVRQAGEDASVEAGIGAGTCPVHGGPRRFGRNCRCGGAEADRQLHLCGRRVV